MRQRTILPALLAAMLTAALASCDDDSAVSVDSTTPDAGTTTPTASSAPPPTTAPDARTTTPTGSGAVDAGAAFPQQRCEANRAAGPITYLSGFDFAATASIVDVIVADAAGYYEELCLDVELVASFSTDNYPLIASGEAQFASGGSFSEVVTFAEVNDADLVAVTVEGRTPIDVLIVKPGTARTLDDLAGSTIGVKRAITPSVAAMLADVGLVEGRDYDTVLLDGFDPTAHIAIDGIVGFPGWKSNEPGQLERAGIEFDLFDPADSDIPGSFGVIFTSRAFLDEHPTAVQDFARATMRGLADAIADPEAAASVAVELINGNGNPNFLSPEGEASRWATDAQLVSAGTPAGSGIGVPDAEALQDELTAYAEIGLFGDEDVPRAAEHLDESALEGVYTEDGTIIWPT